MIVIKPMPAQGAAHPDETSKRIKAAFRRAFTYYENMGKPNLTPEYWIKAAESMQDVYQQGGGDPLLADLLKACYADLERRTQEGEAELMQAAAG